MPCYDPPPPWEGRARESGEKAAALLCRLVRANLENRRPVPREVLLWFVEHRRIDLSVATFGRVPNREELNLILRDIERVIVLLAGQEEGGTNG